MRRHGAAGRRGRGRSRAIVAAAGDGVKSGDEAGAGAFRLKTGRVSGFIIGGRE